jgi:uncharacterized protein YndB with AHSA1/START domain/predicted enzyme related to lactoylglutathione lyase
MMAKAQVRYIVYDVDAAIGFYCRHLGFREVVHPSRFFAMLERGDLRLVLSKPNPAAGGGQPMPDGTEQKPGGWNHFAVKVEDLSATVSTLRQAGVHFRNDIVNGVGGRQIIIDDPSGNPVKLFEPCMPEARLETVDRGHVAKTAITINASLAKVWDAFVNPKVIREYMFGTEVVSEWKVGSPIVWKGVWKGKKYEDKGVILKLEPERVIQYSHFSPLSGLPDTPENYHAVTVKLTRKKSRTLVSLSQDNNPTEQACEHSKENWKMMLAGLKNLLEEKKHRR